jgi:ABC-type antimicrobial peptide transport system ATPase subunit
MAALGDQIIRYAQEDKWKVGSYVTRLANIDRRISGTNDKFDGSRGWDKVVCKTVAMVWQEPDTPGLLDMDRVLEQCKLFQ